jgi:hypothetical protein
MSLIADRSHAHTSYRWSVWFGNTYLGFDAAKSFNEIFGPPLFVLFAVLSNTLLLTVLVSLLSNTFSAVAANADEEAMFHHTSQTLAGVSTDALFSYVPPLNLLCVAIVWPASYILTPRYLHKLNVFLIRATSFPILFAIHVFEQWSYRTGIELTAERAGQALSLFPIGASGKGGIDVIEAVFVRDDDCGDPSWEQEALHKVKEATDGGDREAPNRLSRNLMEASVLESDPAEPEEPKSPSQNQTEQGRNSQEEARRKASDGGYAGGLGHAASPLAKFFGRRQGAKLKEEAEETTTEKGGPTDVLLAKVERLEEQNRRMEALLVKLSEQLSQR